VLGADLIFFITHSLPQLRLLSIPLAYLLLFWLMAQPYGMALVTEGWAPLRAGRQGLLFVLANPVFSMAVSIPLFALIGLTGLFWLPALLVTPVWVSLVSVCATRDLVRKYEALEQAQGREPVIEEESD